MKLLVLLILLCMLLITGSICLAINRKTKDITTVVVVVINTAEIVLATILL